jgi:pimeloyl-ACP methyl ester carboxylesterase
MLVTTHLASTFGAFCTCTGLGARPLSSPGSVWHRAVSAHVCICWNLRYAVCRHAPDGACCTPQVELTSATPELWGAKCVDDVASCVARLQHDYPGAPLLAAGFSYGGHVLQTYMAMQTTAGNVCPLVGAVTFSSLFDTHDLAQPKWPPYGAINTTMCININWPHLPALGEAIGRDLVGEIRQRMPPRPSCRTAELYHDIVSRHFTEPPCASGKEFLVGLTQLHTSFLSSIKVPTLCLMAADDPLCPASAVKRATRSARLSDSVFLLRTRRGGHCGWFEGLSAHSWSDSVALEFLTASLKHRESSQL